jgi:hypothetical protein
VIDLFECYVYLVCTQHQDYYLYYKFMEINTIRVVFC